MRTKDPEILAFWNALLDRHYNTHDPKSAVFRKQDGGRSVDFVANHRGFDINTSNDSYAVMCRMLGGTR